MDPNDFDRFDIPVASSWLYQLAEGIKNTACKREASWILEQQQYGMTLEVAAVLAVEDQKLAALVVRCLKTHWNESFIFAEQFGHKVEIKRPEVELKPWTPTPIPAPKRPNTGLLPSDKSNKDMDDEIPF